MNRFFSVIFILFLLGIAGATFTSGRLVYNNGTTAVLSYDTDTASYKDTSAANPNVYAEICANDSNDLLGNFTALFYRSGSESVVISPLAAEITSVNASNCSIVDVDISLYKGYYPGIVSIGVANTSVFPNNNTVFIDLTSETGLLSGRYEYTATTNATNTRIHIEKIYYSGTNEITSDKPYLIVALYNGLALQNTTIINRTADAVFPPTVFNEVRVNNISASVYGLGGGEGEGGGKKGSLALSLSTSGYAGDEVEFTVIDSDDKGVLGATVTIYRDLGGSRERVATCRTNSDGVCAKLITEAGDYVAVAEKSGYYDSDEDEFSLRLHKMSISVSETYYLYRNVTVSAKDMEMGVAVEDVMLELYSPSGGKLASCHTSVDGTCMFKSAYFSTPGTYSLLGTKQYYENSGASFGVLLYPLDVDYPSSVYTRERFDISVYSLGKPVDKARISFENASYTTDEDGRVAGLVFNSPGTYGFTAEKADYEVYEGDITVAYPPMSPVWPNETYAKETFMMAIESPDPSCTKGVTISINGYNFTTSDDGTAEVYIPLENNYTVTLTKEGCAPYKELKEIPYRPPEQKYEVPIVANITPSTLVEDIAETIGLGSTVKSGCSGIYIEGIPTVFCDIIWLLVVLSMIANLLIGDDNLRRLTFGFSPLIIALLTVPVAGAIAGAIAFAFSYKSWLDARATEAAMKEKAEEIGMEIVGEKPPEQGGSPGQKPRAKPPEQGGPTGPSTGASKPSKD